MKCLFYLGTLTIALLCVGCFQVQSDDLREVPVTNNPNIIPRTSQLAEANGFGY